MKLKKEFRKKKKKKKKIYFYLTLLKTNTIHTNKKLIKNSHSFFTITAHTHLNLFNTYENKSEDAVRILLKHGPDINFKKKKKWWSPYILCLPQWKSKFNKFFVERGDINNENKDVWTPFVIACIKGHKNIIKYFVKRGVDTNINNNNGKTLSYL